MRNRSNDSNYHWDYQDYRGNYGQSPARARKSSGLKYFLIAMGVVILLVGALCVGASVWGSKPAPQPDQDSSIGNELEHLPEIDQQNKPDDSMPEQTEDGLLTPAGIYKKCAPSVVGIVSNSSSSTAQGSGIILSENGYIITNAHVVSGGEKFEVVLQNGDSYNATVIGADNQSDLALLKMQNPPEGLVAATFGNSDELEVGEMVVAIGNPLGRLAATETVGYVSGINREVTTDNTVISMLQTDAAINPGNSGGPLFNMYGEVIGITTAKHSGTTIEGIGFAIPIDDVMGIISDLIDYGYVTGAYMGITVKDNDKEAAAQFGLPTDGAYVVDVTPGSSADKAGIQSKDLITAVDDHKITTRSDLTRTLRNYKAGDTAEITVVRSGRELTLTITFDEKPHDTTVETTPQEDSSMPSEGDYGDWYEYFRRFFGG